MRNFVRLFTFFLVILAITFFNVPAEGPAYKSYSLSSSVDQSVDYSSTDDSPLNTESEEESVEVELYETEYLIHERPFIHSPETLTLNIQDNFPVFISSYIFSIYVPPLTASFV